MRPFSSSTRIQTLSRVVRGLPAKSGGGAPWSKGNRILKQVTAAIDVGVEIIKKMWFW
jgi:hypothetical protein